MKNLWWGYIHENGTLQVKRFFDARDIEDARESPFVRVIFPPVQADTREEAVALMEELERKDYDSMSPDFIYS